MINPENSTESKSLSLRANKRNRKIKISETCIKKKSKTITNSTIGGTINDGAASRNTTINSSTSSRRSRRIKENVSKARKVKSNKEVVKLNLNTKRCSKQLLEKDFE